MGTGGKGPITVGLSPTLWLAQEMLAVCAEGSRWSVGGEQLTQVGWCSIMPLCFGMYGALQQLKAVDSTLVQET